MLTFRMKDAEESFKVLVYNFRHDKGFPDSEDYNTLNEILFSLGELRAYMERIEEMKKANL